MLPWPAETPFPAQDIPEWHQTGSNLILDFHGDPARAALVIFSDGNHHMALEESILRFQEERSDLGGIFYATTPPGPVLTLLRENGLRLGNFILSVRPHVFISPPAVLDTLVGEGYMEGHVPFVENRGNVLLVRRTNPKGIRGVEDLAREDVRIFLSNPRTEEVSYKCYVATVVDMAARRGINLSFLAQDNDSPRVIHGECIHHREAPQALACDRADVAVLFYHLALRYTRIFADHFEMVPLPGSPGHPEADPDNLVSRTHAGLIGDGGSMGGAFLDFLLSEKTAAIYRRHGLLPLS